MNGPAVNEYDVHKSMQEFILMTSQPASNSESMLNFLSGAQNPANTQFNNKITLGPGQSFTNRIVASNTSAHANHVSQANSHSHPNTNHPPGNPNNWTRLDYDSMDSLLGDNPDIFNKIVDSNSLNLYDDFDLKFLKNLTKREYLDLEKEINTECSKFAKLLEDSKEFEAVKSDLLKNVELLRNEPIFSELEKQIENEVKLAMDSVLTQRGIPTITEILEMEHGQDGMTDPAKLEALNNLTNERFHFHTRDIKNKVTSALNEATGINTNLEKILHQVLTPSYKKEKILPVVSQYINPLYPIDEHSSNKHLDMDLEENFRQDEGIRDMSPKSPEGEGESEKYKHFVRIGHFEGFR